MEKSRFCASKKNPRTGPSVEEWTLLFLEAQDRLVSSADVPIKMPPRRNMPLTEAYEQEFEQRVMARMEDRLDQFVDQLANRMNDMMYPRRRKDRNSQGSEGEESENPFFDGNGSSSDEQPNRPRQGLIDWLVAVEEVFEFKEVPENKRVSLIDNKLRGGGSGSSNVAYHFVPNQAKPSGGSGLKCFNCGETGHRQSECKKAGKRTLFAEPEEWEDDGVANDDYEKALVFDDDQYEEEVVTRDVGVNLMVRRSCLTPQAVGDDWLKHNIFKSTFTILGKTYKDSVWCDMLPMDTYHLLLGRPWEYDHNTTHNGKADTYSFLFDSVKITLMLNKPKEIVNKPTGTLLTLSQFEDGLEMGDEVHKAVHDNLVPGNSKYKQDADQLVSTKKIGPLEIIEKIDSNAYRLKLPNHIRCSYVFNVKHLLPYHGDSSDDDLVVNTRANSNYPWGNDAGPCFEERALLFLEAQDHLVSGAEVPVKMPPRRNRPLTEAYEQEFEQRVMARMEERLDQFVDQLADRMNDMVNLRRHKDRNSQGNEGKESENLFFKGDDSSSDEQPDRPRQNQREDNRHWESGIRVNIPEFDGFIDWLVAVEEVFEFKEVPENRKVSLITTKLRGRASAWWQQLKVTRERELESQESLITQLNFNDVQLFSRYIGGLRVQIMDYVNMFDPVTLSDSYQRALAFEKQNRWVGSSSSPAIIGCGFGSSNVASHFSECKKVGKRTLFTEPEEWEDNDVANDDYEEALVFDDDQYEEEVMTGDVGVNLMVCTFVVDPGSCDNLIAEEAVQKLGLKTENRPKPYKLQWLKNGSEMGGEVHEAVRDNLVRANSKHKQDADQVDFEVGDFMWVVLTKDRFPVGEYNKLSTKKIGPLEIIGKIDSNAYRLKLPSHIRCCDVFNMKHLLPYHSDSSNDDLVVNSRANFVYPEGMIQAQVLNNGPFCFWMPEIA
ncbi:putative reverse transcriptase domain-containing protein [Tanacetum coccineum]